jgi:16S rRNA processing protein RimM
VHGAILVRGSGSVCEALRAGLAVRVEPKGPGERELDAVIHHSKAHAKGAIVELAGVDDRDAAALLAGRSLAARRSELPAAGAGEYYACDVIGLSAYSPAGERLGVVREIVSTGANDVWVVTDGMRELLVPAVAHAVIEVDLAQGRVVVEPAAASRSNER